MACLSLRSLLAVAVVAVVGSITRVIMEAVWQRVFCCCLRKWYVGACYFVSWDYPVLIHFVSLYYFRFLRARAHFYSKQSIQSNLCLYSSIAHLNFVDSRVGLGSLPTPGS
jgi:hypothetical protein